MYIYKNQNKVFLLFSSRLHSLPTTRLKESSAACDQPQGQLPQRKVKPRFLALCSRRAAVSLPEGRRPPDPAGSTVNTSSAVAHSGSRELRQAVPSQSPWGSTEPLVTFLTFFMFSITPDVVTTDSISKSSSS